MSVKSVEELKEAGINYDESNVWTCKNCGFDFIGIDEDRPSGKHGLCPGCYNSKIEEYGFIPETIEEKKLSGDEIDEIIIKYICKYYQKYNEFDRINDINELRKLLAENFVSYHYESQGGPVWSYSPLRGGIKPFNSGRVSELSVECIYDLLHCPPRND